MVSRSLYGSFVIGVLANKLKKGKNTFVIRLYVFFRVLCVVKNNNNDKCFFVDVTGAGESGKSTIVKQMK